MTLAVAWVRRLRDCEELIVASDSRLNGGRTLDSCAKILALPRSDSFICCAGETDLTYPLAMQAYSAIATYERGRDRSLDIHDLKGHVLKILNAAVKEISSPLPELRQPNKETQLLFGGYSWIAKRFDVWRISYSRGQHRFISSSAASWCNGRAPIIFAGDMQWIARKRLIDLLRKRHGVTPQSNIDFHWNWEPFEILRDLLREAKGDKRSTIGGPPQVMKVYQHMNCRYVGVYWPSKDEGNIAVAGRTVLGYETPDAWILDPDTLRTRSLIHSADDEGESVAKPSVCGNVLQGVQCPEQGQEGANVDK